MNFPYILSVSLYILAMFAHFFELEDSSSINRFILMSILLALWAIYWRLPKPPAATG